ncbi:MAG: T9SS C-terminal target domain-containing protein [Candidatus Zixiibacteriota bacterium]|nr:MAG: T9SS C-terminal target domain-containing protein [candidate division Zixibacteria bacterium]
MTVTSSSTYRNPIMRGGFSVSLALLLTAAVLTAGLLPAAGTVSAQPPEAPEVGQTQVFWALAQGFFSGYYQLSATLQDTSEHAYLYTEDAYINDLSVSLADGQMMYAAANGGVFHSTDGGNHWMPVPAGLPDVNGAVPNDSDNYNFRAVMHALFARAEYGEPSFDTVWVGTDFGPFWSYDEPDTFRARSANMATDPETAGKPPTYDILGHPNESRTLWAATEDGLYMTRNANNWRRLSGGLPPGEGVAWQSGPAYAVTYDAASGLLWTATNRGVFYGTYRVLGTNPTADIIADWMPLGGTVALDSVLSANADTLTLRIEDSTAYGLSLAAGQTLTLVDTARDLYWSALVDEAAGGLFVRLTDAGLFYYPDTLPAVNYAQLPLNQLVAYGYSQVSGQDLHLETLGDVTTVWLATPAGIVSYRLTGDFIPRYEPDQVSREISHDSLAVYKIDKKGNDYYLATDQGLYRAADPHGQWTRLTGFLYNNDRTDSVAVGTRTVAFGPGNNVFAGGHMGGFVKSADGTTFTPSNLGLMHRMGTAQQLDIFSQEFNQSAPADPQKGIFEIVQDYFGDLPPANSPDDIDQDPRITVLFLDIEDFHLVENAPDPFILTGDYQGINEYSMLYFDNSNQREMIYLDTEPLWINEAGPAAADQVFNLINWNQDFDEEIWLKQGLAQLAQFFAGYSPVSGTIGLIIPNSLTNWGDKLQDTEKEYSFVMAIYLYEQVFSDTTVGGEVIHRVRELAESPYQGVAGLGRLIHEKRVGPTNDTTDYTDEFGELYNDFILATILDISNPEFHEGRYGFDNLTVQASVTGLNWYIPITAPRFLPPYSQQLPFWSGRAVQFEDTPGYFNPQYPIQDLAMNGDDRNDIHFTLLFDKGRRFYAEMSPDSLTLMPVPTDPEQKAQVNLPPDLYLGDNTTPPNVMRLVTVCTSDSGSEYSTYTLEDDIIPPEFVEMTIAQNPVDGRYLDVYTFATDRLFPDGGLYYRVATPPGEPVLEGPKVDLFIADTLLTTLDQNVFFANVSDSSFVYHVAYHLGNLNYPATLEFLAYAEDAAGNEVESPALSVTVDQIQAPVGGLLTDAASSASLTVPPAALQADALLMLTVAESPPGGGLQQGFSRALDVDEPDPTHRPVGPVVSAGSASLGLNSPIELRLPYDRALAGPDPVGVYRAENNGWVYVGGVDEAGIGLLSSYSWKFGKFQVFAGPLGDMKPETPYSFRLEQNYPNPFNPATTIRFQLSRAQQVTVDVYNLQGRRVANLVDGQLSAGHHDLQWAPDGLASGIYFLRLKAEEGNLYRRLMFLK